MLTYQTLLPALALFTIIGNAFPPNALSPISHLNHCDDPSVSIHSSRSDIDRITLTTAPIRVPPMTKDNGMVSHFDPSTALPCRDCIVTRMKSDIHYLGGASATPDTGMWLHHAVYVNRARQDSTCGEDSYGQRFYATGNERTVVDMGCRNGAGKKGKGGVSGYYIGLDDHIDMSVELMNMSDEWKTVTFSTTYEFVTKPPKHAVPVEPVWLDIGGCHGSNVPAERDSIFEYNSPPWTSSSHGHVFFAAGHLHDGGSSLEILKNDEIVCNPLPIYQGAAKDDNVYHGGGQEHINAISTCKDFTSTRPGDQWTIKAKYNTTAHPPMENMDGSLEPVMGIALMYIARTSHDHMHHQHPPSQPEHRVWWSKWNAVPLIFAIVLLTSLIGFQGYQKRQQLRHGQIHLGLLSDHVGFPRWLKKH